MAQKVMDGLIEILFKVILHYTFLFTVRKRYVVWETVCRFFTFRYVGRLQAFTLIFRYVT